MCSNDAKGVRIDDALLCFSPGKQQASKFCSNNFMEKATAPPDTVPASQASSSNLNCSKTKLHHSSQSTIHCTISPQRNKKERKKVKS